MPPVCANAFEAFLAKFIRAIPDAIEYKSQAPNGALRSSRRTLYSALCYLSRASSARHSAGASRRYRVPPELRVLQSEFYQRRIVTIFLIFLLFLIYYSFILFQYCSFNTLSEHFFGVFLRIHYLDREPDLVQVCKNVKRILTVAFGAVEWQRIAGVPSADVRRAPFGALSITSVSNLLVTRCLCTSYHESRLIKCKFQAHRTPEITCNIYHALNVRSYWMLNASRCYNL